MILLNLVDGMKQGVSRDDLAASYTSFLNEAQREICGRRSWTFMRDEADVTVLNGASSAALPANFKELSSSKTPIHAVGSDGVSLVPCDVVTREQRIRRNVIYPLVISNTPRLYIDWTVQPPILNLFATATENLVFNVSYFGYMADLSADGDHNALTDSYPEMLLAKAKAIAFGRVNDPAVVDAEEYFQLKFDDARREDSYKALAGLQMRM